MFVFIIAGCLILSTPLFAGPASESAEAGGMYGGTLTIGTVRIDNELRSADLRTGDWAMDTYCSPFLERLVIGDVDGAGPRGKNLSPFDYGGGGIGESVITGEIADSWEVTPTKLIYHIRDGIMWYADHVDFMETRELTAEDVAVSWNWWKEHDLGTSYFIDKIYAEGDTVVMTWEKPNYLWVFWTGCGAGGVAVIPPEVIEVGSDQWENQVGTGPFYVSEIERASYAKYKKNPIYWNTTIIDGEEYSLPFADDLVYPVIPDEATRISALRTAKLDLLVYLNIAQGDTLLSSNPDLKSHKYTDSQWGIILQCSESQYKDLYAQADAITDGKFVNQDLRHALSYATDQKALGDAIYGPGNYELNAWWLPVGGPEWTAVGDMPTEVAELYGYNPEKAKQLMSNAGYPDGFEFTLMMQSTASAADIGAAVKDQWSKVGIDVTLQPLESAAISALRHSLAFPDARLSTLGSSPRQVADYTNTRIKRYSGLWDPGFDNNFADAAETTDPGVRSEKFKDLALELIWDNDMVMLPAPKALVIWWPWLQNYYGEINFGYNNIVPALSRMWIDKEVKDELGY